MSSVTSRTLACPFSMMSSPTDTGSVNRRRPAAPGLTYSTPLRSTQAGLCVWPVTTTRTPLAAGSMASSFRSCSMWMATPPKVTVTFSGRARAQAPLSLLPRTLVSGASSARRSSVTGSTMSPACRMASLPCRKSSACGRSRPCVSEIRPMRMTTYERLLPAILAIVTTEYSAARPTST